MKALISPAKNMISVKMKMTIARTPLGMAGFFRTGTGEEDSVPCCNSGDSVVALSSALQLQQRFVPPLLRLRGGWRRFRRYCVLTTSCMAGPPQDGGLQSFILDFTRFDEALCSECNFSGIG